MFPAIRNAANRNVSCRKVFAATAVRAVQAGDRERPQKYMGNPQYQPLAISQCALLRLPTSKVHQQTCDSMCVGPPDANGARTITVIDEVLNQRANERWRPGTLHSVSVQVLFLCTLHVVFSPCQVVHRSCSYTGTLKLRSKVSNTVVFEYAAYSLSQHV